MLLKIAGATALAAGAGLASMDYVVVDVKADRAAPRIVVPVPLLAAEAALSFVPQRELRVDMGRDAERLMPVARELAAELRRMPDAELVTVEDGDETVRVSKRGDLLEVRVRSGSGEQVDVNVPLECLERALASFASGRLDVRGVLSALHRADGKIVEVRNGTEHVRVYVW
ncbi:MAG TPA: hypothetical protein VFM88_01365 [Vicinamibacteria bacterium]|nr:hypothetical protein [Vicinamibacteria bacterium]